MFSEQERQIYHCPHTNRDYDPLAVRRALTIQTQNTFGRLCTEAADPDPVKQALAQEALIAAARKAFGWPPLQVLDATVWDALIAFTEWLKGKGKRATILPETLPSTAGPGNPITERGSP